MVYVRDHARLAGIVRTLASHEVDTRHYYLAYLNGRLTDPMEVKDRLTTLFAIANAQRQGSARNLLEAAAHFHQGIDDIAEQCRRLGAQDGHAKFLNWLCDINGMGQKTANLFLKWLAMFEIDFQLGVLKWSAWAPYLHVPLDRWVVRLLGEKYLDACTAEYHRDFVKDGNKENPRYEKLDLRAFEYSGLQRELADVALLIGERRIVFDVLWFVGAQYCSYHPLLCRACWVREHCRSYQTPDLEHMYVQSRAERRRERQDQQREQNREVRAWAKQHPEVVTEIRERLGRNEPTG